MNKKSHIKEDKYKCDACHRHFSLQRLLSGHINKKCTGHFNMEALKRLQASREGKAIVQVELDVPLILDRVVD